MNFSLNLVDLPVHLRFEHPLTDEGLMSFCAGNESLRVEREANGELTVMSPSGLEGSGWNSEIIAELIFWNRSEGRGKVFESNGGFTLPDNSMRSPDAAWVSLPRWNALPVQEQKRYGRITPNFVIELRSESDSLSTLRSKMKQWIDNGVELAWLIDPLRKVVEVYRPNEEPEIHEDPTSVQGTGPVRGFELVLSRIWS